MVRSTKKAEISNAQPRGREQAITADPSPSVLLSPFRVCHQARRESLDMALLPGSCASSRLLLSVVDRVVQETISAKGPQGWRLYLTTSVTDPDLSWW